MARNNVFILLSLMLIFSSCSLTDNEQPDVFFLSLSNPKVKLPFINGDDTHKITEVWAFSDGQILGVFPLPAKIPVVYTGLDTEITILAGIRNNGMADEPVFYPFYKSIVKVVKGQVGQTISFPLEFIYVGNAKFPVNESFEGSHCFTSDLDGKAKPELVITSTSPTVGIKSGVVTLTSNENFLEMACTNLIKKGENSRGKSYVELDYKGHGEIAVGLLKTGTGLPKISYHLFIPARENWNKIYVDLTDQTSANDYNEYAIVISVRKTGSNTESNVFIDNIKHIHF